jgi:acetyl esterase/lipase
MAGARTALTIAERMDAELASSSSTWPLIGIISDLAASRQAVLAPTSSVEAQPEFRSRVVHEEFVIAGLDDDPTVRVKYYRPAATEGTVPCLYWIHGGGYVQGAPQMDDVVMDEVVSTLGCSVASVDWRRAPEDPFPACLRDCYAGLLWLADNGSALGIDTARIAIGGASSGAGTAAAVALFVRDHGGPKLILQLLLYPMLDDRTVDRDDIAYDMPQVWNPRYNQWAWRGYLGSAYGTESVSPYAAPARATDLTGLPPAYMAVPELDLFWDEDIDYARRLTRAGVPAELHVYPGAFHGFDRKCPQAAVSQRFMRDYVHALKDAFERDRWGSAEASAAVTRSEA